MHAELSTVWLLYLYCTTIEVVMSKDMKYVHSNLIRSPMTSMDNDAKSFCYRILSLMTSMIIHHFGVPEDICRNVGETLQTMQFRIWAGLGDSAEFYSHSINTPIHGVGQGGTASPVFWLLISSTQFDYHRIHAYGMYLKDSTSQL